MAIISDSDLMAEKFGIIHFCINCNKRISITDSELDFPMTHPLWDKNLWIHDKTQLRICYPPEIDIRHYAFPRNMMDGIE